MKRKEFFKKALATGMAGAIAPQMLKAKDSSTSKSTYDKLMQQVGFNHLPNKENKTMNTVIHKAQSRGHANHGWLDSHHTFSFANYRNPERMNFGVIRVLNDDIAQAGRGFGTHPHDNMEIISIPLEGDLEHKDSMRNVAIIKEGDVQVMTAGTGLTHSEFNKNKDKEVKFLQIWLFPKEKNLTPRYDQVSIRNIEKENEFYQVLSPNKDDQGVWINQDAWFHMAKFKKGSSDEYKIQKTNNGVYVFIIDGTVEINGELLSKRDGMGIWDTESITVNATENARVLLMDVPMSI
ncbi:MAG: pirin family protein [Bacteroidia bacterium]|nr:pirin family protein [Bacteroidia bacterium]